MRRIYRIYRFCPKNDNNTCYYCDTYIMNVLNQLWYAHIFDQNVQDKKSMRRINRFADICNIICIN